MRLLKKIFFISIILSYLIIDHGTNSVYGRDSDLWEHVNSDKSIVNQIVPEYGDLRYLIQYRDLSKEIIKFCQDAKITFLHYHGPFSGYRGLPSKNDFYEQRIRIKQIVNTFHSKGIKIILYVGAAFAVGNQKSRTGIFNFYDNEWNNFNAYFSAIQRDPLHWVQRRLDGLPKTYKTATDPGYYVCVNNVDFRSYIKGIIQIIIETGADGVFFDGPFFKDGKCFCDSCEQAFKKFVKAHFPKSKIPALKIIGEKKFSPDDSSRIFCIQRDLFFIFSLTDFLSDMNRYAKKIDSEFIITANYWMSNPYTTLKETAKLLSLWSKNVDFVFVESNYESGPVNINNKKFSNSSFYKYLYSAANGKPIAVLKTSAKSPYCNNMGLLTKLCIAEAVSNGAVWQFHKLERCEQEAASAYNQFLSKHAALFKGWKPYSRNAVITSPLQAIYGNFSYDAAFSQFLSNKHIDHILLGSDRLKQLEFNKYDVLLLPNITFLEDDTIEKIRQFVNQGGGVVIVGDFGKYNEWGELRAVGGLKRFFLNLKSADFKGKLKKQFGQGRIAYIPKKNLPLNPRNYPISNSTYWDEFVSLLRWVNPRPHFIQGSIPDSIECNIMKFEDKTEIGFALHLVNYAIGINDNIRTCKNIELSVENFVPFQLKEIKLISPDNGETYDGVSIPYKTNADNQRLDIKLPEIKIYSIVYLRYSKNKTR
jgi:hypothetical protein